MFDGDVIYPVLDMYSSWYHPFQSFYWKGASFSMEMETSNEGKDIDSMCPGIYSLSNSHPELINV